MQTVILRVPVRVGVRAWFQTTEVGLGYACLELLQQRYERKIGIHNHAYVDHDLAAAELEVCEGGPMLNQELGLCLLDYLTKMGYKLTTAPQVSFEGEHIIMCIYVLVKED